MDAQVLAALVRYVKVGLVILNTRIMILIGMLLCAGATAWTLYDPSWERVVSTALFSVLVFWPVIRLEREKNGGSLASETD
jgi:hypothetical protein